MLNNRAAKKDSRNMASTFSALGLLMPESDQSPSLGLFPSPPSQEIEDNQGDNRATSPHKKKSPRRRQLACVALPSGSEIYPSAIDEVECAICMMDYEETVMIAPCGHSFCRECITSHVQSKLEVRRYPITCPTCVTSAEHLLNPSVIRKDVLTRLNITDEQFTIFKHLETQV
ncbi:hypothetical protein C8F04DRAFT_389044 [Mycena alexandri]|uniref:RING-type domain-containing protein n=1 Tax=Mycena alexandri TaxID=1745969 RepID=A0AAD6T667_9AGAR|nr:hypothetical protein C8F04DRAFT_389044 [Mycena alexandri]